MSTISPSEPFYPDQNGEPMSENTLQYQWIVTLQGNLDYLFRSNPNVVVAGDHLIYPIEGDNCTRIAPDVYIAFGRPKRYRGSYQVWEEGGIFPQVTFEVMSPGNRTGEMANKPALYDRFGVQEYYVYDPDRIHLEIYLRDESGRLAPITETSQFISPLLGIYFELGDDLTVAGPAGEPFLTFVELSERAEAATREARHETRRAETALRRVNYEARRVEEEQRRADTEAARADAIAAQNARLREALKAAGIDPDTV